MRSKDGLVVWRHDKPGLCLQCRHNVGEHKSGVGIHCAAYSPSENRGFKPSEIYDCVRCTLDDRPMLYDL